MNNSESKALEQKPDFDKFLPCAPADKPKNMERLIEKVGKAKRLTSLEKYLQSENQRLTEENNTMLESCGSVNAIMDELEELRLYKKLNTKFTNRDEMVSELENTIKEAIQAFDRPTHQVETSFPEFTAIQRMKRAVGIVDMTNIKVKGLASKPTKCL